MKKYSPRVEVLGYKGLKDWKTSNPEWGQDKELGYQSDSTPGTIYMFHRPSTESFSVGEKFLPPVERIEIVLIPSMDEMLGIVKEYLPMVEGDIPRMIRRNIDGVWFVVSLINETNYTNLQICKYLIDSLLKGRDEEKGEESYEEEY